MQRLAILAMVFSACASAPAAPRAPAPAPAPSPVHTCPSAQPPIDSSCESFETGLGCLYADDSIGCSCMTTSPAERSPDAPWTQVWRCGEHGE